MRTPSSSTSPPRPGVNAAADLLPIYWGRAFARIAPTAAIILRDTHLLSLYGYCAARRIEIPRQLSIVHLGRNPLLEWCHPPPRQTRYPLRHAQARFRRWVMGGLRPIGMKFFKLDVVPGESVCAAPGQKSVR